MNEKEKLEEIVIKYDKELNKLHKEKRRFKICIGCLITMLCFIIATAILYKSEHKYDLNNDGTVDIKDMLVIQKYILDNEGCERDENRS